MSLTPITALPFPYDEPVVCVCSKDKNTRRTTLDCSYGKFLINVPRTSKLRSKLMDCDVRVVTKVWIDDNEAIPEGYMTLTIKGAQDECK